MDWQEYDAIYLQPACGKCIRNLLRYSEGRLWCQDPQDPCEDCGKEWVKYAVAKQPIEAAAPEAK